MLWRKQRSRSPPRLTSTIPEMEQHLAAMDIPLSDSLADQTDAYASAVEDLQAPAPNPESQTAAPPTSSDKQVVPDMAEPYETTRGLDSELPPSFPRKIGTLELKMKLKTARAKAHYSRPRFLTLIVCVSYLLFHLMGINLGLRAIGGYTEPRLQRAQVQLDTTERALAVDYLLDLQLGNLHHVTLQRSYKETRYEDCFVRGLKKAKHVFRGLDFTSNPRTRNQTADWVTLNCDRLFFTPQIHSPRETMLRVRAAELRQFIEDLLKLVRHRLAVRQSKLHVRRPRLAAKFLAMDSVFETEERPRPLPKMPYGFSLACQDQARCRLVHTGPITPPNTIKTLKEAVADARKEVQKWSYNFERMFRCMDYLIRPLAWLQSLLVLCYLLATAISMHRPFPAPEPRLTFAKKKARVWKYICYRVAHVEPQEKRTVGVLINTALYALLGFQLESTIPEVDRLLLPVGLALCIFHFVHAAVFVEPAPEDCPDESWYDIVRAVKVLGLIAQGIDISEPAPAKRSTPKPKNSPPAKPASKVAARFISPLTPIAEDLRQERRAMHAGQGKLLDDTEELSGYVPETDEEDESDVEHGSYVDLAGGVTPTDSEDDGLVIVA